MGKVMTRKLKTKKGSKIPSKPVSVLDKTKQKLQILQEVKGIAKGLWREDAQEYVNKLRRD
jgi:hypothetical protein